MAGLPDELSTALLTLGHRLILFGPDGSRTLDPTEAERFVVPEKRLVVYMRGPMLILRYDPLALPKPSRFIRLLGQLARNYGRYLRVLPLASVETAAEPDDEKEGVPAMPRLSRLLDRALRLLVDQQTYEDFGGEDAAEQQAARILRKDVRLPSSPHVPMPEGIPDTKAVRAWLVATTIADHTGTETDAVLHVIATTTADALAEHLDTGEFPRRLLPVVHLLETVARHLGLATELPKRNRTVTESRGICAEEYERFRAWLRNFSVDALAETRLKREAELDRIRRTAHRHRLEAETFALEEQARELEAAILSAWAEGDDLGKLLEGHDTEVLDAVGARLAENARPELRRAFETARAGSATKLTESSFVATIGTPTAILGTPSAFSDEPTVTRIEVPDPEEAEKADDSTDGDEGGTVFEGTVADPEKLTETLAGRYGRNVASYASSILSGTPVEAYSLPDVVLIRDTARELGEEEFAAFLDQWLEAHEDELVLDTDDEAAEASKAPILRNESWFRYILRSRYGSAEAELDRLLSGDKNIDEEARKAIIEVASDLGEEDLLKFLGEGNTSSADDGEDDRDEADPETMPYTVDEIARIVASLNQRP